MRVHLRWGTKMNLGNIVSSHDCVKCVIFCEAHSFFTCILIPGELRKCLQRADFKTILQESYLSIPTSMYKHAQTGPEYLCMEQGQTPR